MPLEARKFDSSNPVKPDGIRPFKLPKEWTAGDDLFASLLGAGAMVSGVGLLLKQPMLAYVGFFLAVAHWAHDRPLSRSKESSSSPSISLIFATMSIMSAIVPKLIELPQNA